MSSAWFLIISFQITLNLKAINTEFRCCDQDCQTFLRCNGEHDVAGWSWSPQRPVNTQLRTGLPVNIDKEPQKRRSEKAEKNPAICYVIFCFREQLLVGKLQNDEAWV